MPGWDDEHQAVGPQEAALQVRRCRFLAEKSEHRLTFLQFLESGAAVPHRGPDVHERELLAKRREQGREETFSGDGTRRERQIARDGLVQPAQGLAGLVLQQEDLLGVIIQTTSQLGEVDLPRPPLEERDLELTFERGDPLAHGRLRNPQLHGCGGETPQLRGPGEGSQVRQFGKSRAGGGYGHTDSGGGHA